MSGRRPIFVKPGDDSLYPFKNKDGVIEPLTNPNIDSALQVDRDSTTSFVYNRYHHLPLQVQRQKLPVFQYRNHILYLLEKYQTLVLIGETGCGKSTQVPQYLNEIGHRVCVTQPRAAAAASLASRAAEERGERLGEHVGYCAAAESVRTPECGLVFMTEGVLLREMFASPLLMQYSAIMLDEVHERTQMTDVLMGLLKKIAKKRKNLKLVISSATMDAEFLKDFFNLAERKEKGEGQRGKTTSVIMSIQGRTHPIDVFYTQEPVADYVKAVVDTVIKIHENEPFGDILAFLTSQEEIHSALETLTTYAHTTNERVSRQCHFASGVLTARLSVLPLYGSLPPRRQIAAFRMADSGVRKVVLATNVAETSVTIPGISYVIDSGFHKLPYWEPSVGVACVCVAPVSRNNAAQRAGRAGRTARGAVYRLYTEEEYERLPASVPPEMCRSDLSAVLLRLKALGIDNLLRFTFPTAPPAKSLLAALETLYALHALDRLGQLSPVGAVMAELPLAPMAARILCSSAEYGCIDEALSIVSLLQVDNVFLRHGSGKDNIAAAVARRKHFEVAEGDIIMYLNIFDAYLRVKNSYKDEKSATKAVKAWCQNMYLNWRVMEKACEVRDGLEKLVKDKFKMENKAYEGPDLGTGKCIRTMKCVVSGLFPQAAYLHTDGSYRGVRGATLHIATDSCLYRLQQPKWVVFASVDSAGDRTYMRDLMAVDKAWLLEVAPHYYRDT